MDQGVRRGQRIEPLLQRIESRPFGPLWLTLLVWTSILAAYVSWCALFGDLALPVTSAAPISIPRETRTAAVVAFIIAFFFAAHRWEARAAISDWRPLRPFTGLSSSAFEGLITADAFRAIRSPLWLDAAGAILGVAVVLLSSGQAETRGEGWSPSLVWALGANAVLFAMLLRAARASFLGRHQTQRIAAALVDLDLLDTAPLRCFARQGLRRAFYWAAGSSVASLLALDLERAWPTVVIVSATLGLATFALVSPVRVARDRIRRTKQAELDRVRQRIRARRDALLSGGPEGDRDASAELPGLLAYESRIEAVREWPFDASTLLRFGALALLASGSWLGGALVERLLDVALD